MISFSQKMMKCSLCLSLMAITAITAQENPTIKFTNGDRLLGQLKRLDNDVAWWESVTLNKETPFFLSQIQEISFPLKQAPPTAQDHIAHIRFNQDLRQQNENLPGDVIDGELVAVNQNHIILNTWYAGKLKLNRNMVKDLEITDVAPAIYTGPLKQDEWLTFPAESWTFENNTYSGGGNLVRDFKKLPERYCFRFTAAWRNRFNIQLFFGADSAEEGMPENHYMLMLDNGTTYLQKRSTNANALGGMMRNGGMIGEYKRDNSFRTKEKSDLRLFVDTTSGLIALYSDDTLLQEWNDMDKPVLNGSCIHIRQGTPQGNKIQISRISLTTWDGILPNVQDSMKSNPIDNPDPVGDEQRIILRNGDVILGEVKAIENSEISLITRFNEIKLPVSRIRKLALSPTDYDERLLQQGDVRAWFADGNYITFRFDGVDENGKIIGYSQHFGTAHFDTAAFTRIEFNIYPRSLKK